MGNSVRSSRLKTDRRQIRSVPTDGEIIRVQSEHPDRQMEYIRSCVRKNKGLSGKNVRLTRNQSISFILRNDY